MELLENIYNNTRLIKYDKSLRDELYDGLGFKFHKEVNGILVICSNSNYLNKKIRENPDLEGFLFLLGHIFYDLQINPFLVEKLSSVLFEKGVEYVMGL